MYRLDWLKKSMLVLAIVLVAGISVSARDVQDSVTGYAVEQPHVLTAVSETDVPTEAEAYARIIAMKKTYPEGMRWTNDNYYDWKGGIYRRGYGCAGFAFLLSDAAFGDLPARKVTDFVYEDLKVGDILRIKNDTHSVVILEVHEDHVVIAEGNYAKSIHWGRHLEKKVVMAANYMLTRYPMCTITFDANGGTMEQTSMAATPGVCYGELPVPVREGYQFLGWYTGKEDGEPVSAEDVVGQITAQTLYAHWKQDTVIAGTMGTDCDLVWSYQETLGTLTVTGDLGEGGKVMVASYDESQRLISIDVITVSGDSAQTDISAAQINLFWLDGNNCPRSQQAEFMK